MRFKKFIFWKMLCFAVLFLGILGMRSYAFAEGIGSESAVKCSQAPSEKISRGRVFGNKILCMETFECFPETEVLKENNKKFYKKTLKVTKEFKIPKEDHSFKTMAQYEFQIIFTYDKDNFVEIENPEKDISFCKNKGNWKIMDVKEIFPEDKIWLVSVKCALYKEGLLGSHEYIMDDHVDSFCSVMGNIGINTGIH